MQVCGIITLSLERVVDHGRVFKGIKVRGYRRSVSDILFHDIVNLYLSRCGSSNIRCKKLRCFRCLVMGKDGSRFVNKEVFQRINFLYQVRSHRMTET